jgi:hypothetical protein
MRGPKEPSRAWGFLGHLFIPLSFIQLLTRQVVVRTSDRYGLAHLSTSQDTGKTLATAESRNHRWQMEAQGLWTPGAPLWSLGTLQFLHSDLGFRDQTRDCFGLC